jgi:hypothetical protein
VAEELDGGLGVRKVGMPAFSKSWRPSRTCSSPIQQVNSGLSAVRSISMICWATSVDELMACGQSIVSTPSTFSSASTTSRVLR